MKSLSNLEAEEPLHLHIADDGSGPGHVNALRRAIPKGVFDEVTESNVEGRGYGASYNAATQVTHELSDLVLPLEDDWHLERVMDLTLYSRVLREGTFNCIRLGYVGFTQELRGTFVAADDRLWLALDPMSPEPHVFAGGPRLETVEFERSLGPWPEGLPAGATEWEVCHRAASRVNVAWPISLVNPDGDLFVHIGSEKAETAGRP